MPKRSRASLDSTTSRRSTRVSRTSTSASTATSRRRGGRNSLGGGRHLANQSSKVCRKWAQVLRPPRPGINFKALVWVPVEELDEEERKVYDEVAEKRRKLSAMSQKEKKADGSNPSSNHGNDTMDVDPSTPSMSSGPAKGKEAFAETTKEVPKVQIKTKEESDQATARTQNDSEKTDMEMKDVSIDKTEEQTSPATTGEEISDPKTQDVSNSDDSEEILKQSGKKEDTNDKKQMNEKSIITTGPITYHPEYKKDSESKETKDESPPQNEEQTNQIEKSLENAENISTAAGQVVKENTTSNTAEELPSMDTSSPTQELSNQPISGVEGNNKKSVKKENETNQTKDHPENSSNENSTASTEDVNDSTTSATVANKASSSIEEQTNEQNVGAESFTKQTPLTE